MHLPTSDISMININTADLNLLRVFVVIFEEKSATGAAQRLNLTQSAVSLNLRRLREMYQDSLFTRTGRGLAPTLFANQVYPLAKDALDRFTASLQLHENKQAEFMGRTITIGLSDDFEIALGETMIELAKNIPNCTRLHFRQSNSNVVAEMLLARSIDLAITSGGCAQEGITLTNIGEGTYGCLVDPATFDSNTMDLETLLSHDHIMVSRTGFFGIVDDVLVSRGLRRRVRASTSHFSAIPYLLTGTDCITIMPAHAAKFIAKTTHLKYFPAPIDFPSFSVCLAWRNFSRKDQVLSDLVQFFRTKLKGIITT